MQDELGLYVCGGRGKHSRNPPDELKALGDRTGIDGDGLTRASRLVAKVDSAAVQDGFELYLHGFFVTAEGTWTVVQQGMNGDKKQARRYHWHSRALQSFVEEPHSAIDGPAQGEIINLTDRRAENSRKAQLQLLADVGPDRIVAEFEALQSPGVEANRTAASGHAGAPRCAGEGCFHTAPARHASLRPRPSAGPRILPIFCSIPASAPERCARWRWWRRSCMALSSRAPPSARFSLAHGGKDRHPDPVSLEGLRRNPAG